MAHIRTFCRIKPAESRFVDYQVATNVLHIQIPENLPGSNHLRSQIKINHDFKFTQVFKQNVTQQDVFNRVAKDIVQGFLNGYNGTIFAYGQTGSGKTYTVEGSARKYQDRGLAPRALSMIYSSLESRQDEDVTVHVSYMEIYQETGYDLLTSASRMSTLLTAFPKVTVLEGPKGSCVMRNLSQHLAPTEDVAQSLLLEGQANRRVAETPMNLRSSRSHAVFTVHLTAKKPNDDVVTRSKLHLVDLAGSERVSKSGIDGHQLTEAKYINLSLHHLEGVIIALQQESSGSRPQLPSPNFTLFNRSHPNRCQSAPCLRTEDGWVNALRPGSATSAVNNPLGQSTSQSRHVPYRNSLLTMVLRDSLGGNCQTAMIATITFEEDNLGESLSTCRFAQRVACITNVLRKNEEIDDQSLIRKLRKRVAELESEVSLLRENLSLPATTDVENNKLTDEDKLECSRIMQAFIGGAVRDPITAGVTSTGRFRECLHLLKKVINTQCGRDPVVLVSHRRRPQLTDNMASSVAQSKVKPRSHNASPTSPDSELLTPPLSPKSKQNLIEPKPEKVFPRLVEARGAKRNASRPGSSTSKTDSITTSSKAPEPGMSQQPVEKYKSPYQRQMEAQTHKLDQKVLRDKQSLQTQTTELKQQQQEIRLSRLQVMRKELGMKLSKASEQLKEQKMFILKLKENRSDMGLIKEEMLIAKQLQKREKDVKQRLLLINEELEQHKAETAAPVIRPRAVKPDVVSPPTSSSVSSQASDRKVTPQTRGMEHRYPECVKRDGSLNTRQVFDILKSQDKKQEKLKSDIEKQKVYTRSKEIEVKEAATRQKLQEFKEKLRQAKLGTDHTSFRNTNPDSDPVPQTKPPIPSPRSAFSSTKAVTNVGSAISDGRSVSDTDQQKLHSASRAGSAASSAGGKDQQTRSRQGSATSRTSFIHPAQSHTNISAMELAESLNRTRKKDVSDMWGSERQTSIPGDVDTGMKTVYSRDVSASPIKDSGYEDIPEYFRNVHAHSSHEDSLQTSSASDTSVLDQSVFQDNRSSYTNEVSLSANRHSKEAFTTRVDTQMAHSQNNTPEFQDEHQTVKDSSPKSHPKSFDNTLQEMLGTESQQVPTYQHQDYDKYARRNKKSAKTASRTGSPAKGKRDLRSDNERRPVSRTQPWITEGKNVTSDMLYSYRNPGQTHGDSGLSHSNHTEKILGNVVSRESEEQNEEHSTDSKRHKSRVKALDDSKREQNYMSTVRSERQRVARIKQAQRAAEVIQRAWRGHKRTS